VVVDADEVQSMWQPAEAALAAETVLRPGEGGDRTPVVVCLWKRQHRVGSIIAMLARQSAQCDLYLWNNDPSRATTIAATVAAAAPSAMRIVVATSETNIGGFGRFFFARSLAATHPYVVFVDDDELIGDDTIATFLAEVGPGRICSAWGFAFAQRRDYWRRNPVAVGEAAKYCGTGGMVADASVFLDERLFRCPPRFWFCEDIWLSYFASTALRWSLTKSGAEVGWLLDDVGQTAELVRAKKQFFRLLNRRGGWIDPPAAVGPRPAG
jgi:hypothetical protein